ncbi:MAG: hypothetical protein PHD74_10355, partial [Candidatus Krumholzibacteria bacterium]|nr:hypothetical protein [Candidatus Krumholzibacteria bacterium]
MRQSFLICSALAMIALFALFLGCEKTFIGPAEVNKAPEVWLSSGPVEGDTTGYQVHFYWGGWDPDGEVASYEFVVVDGDPYGFNPQDTTGLDRWLSTTVHDSTFHVSTSDTFRKVTLGGKLYTRYDMTHTFFIRAVDIEGKRSKAVYRSFTAWTLAPTVTITVPTLASGLNPEASVQTLGKVINFQWRGVDPIDSPDNTQDPDSIRYMHHRVDSPGYGYYPYFNITNDLNKNPWRYEQENPPCWSPWIYYRANGDSGKSTMIGDDEGLALATVYIFAVQAKDDAGAVTSIFSRSSNVRQFNVGASSKVSPMLKITEPYLGGFQFQGTAILNPLAKDLPPGVPLKFKWTATADAYGGLISCYQYGWDVADLTNDDDWESDCNPFNKSCEATWYSGTHTLYVRVYDNSGTETLGQVEVNIVPFRMDRTLLWVDDFLSTDFTQVVYAMPTEKQHDDLWLAHCARAAGFDPSRDVYDCASYSYSAPSVKLIGRYKNIIWTYYNTADGALRDIIQFTPESQLSTGANLAVNYLSIFLAKGGHILTEGLSSERYGGLTSAILGNVVLPQNLKCEMVTQQLGCEGDTSGANCMPYKDFCITVVDKVKGMFRSDEEMPFRRAATYDVMSPCMVKTNDAWNDSVPGMPDSLTLWSECTKTGRFYARTGTLGGFDQLEIYDPQYWLTTTGTSSQGCFHPLYRMKAYNPLSRLHNQAVAVRVTKYAT